MLLSENTNFDFGSKPLDEPFTDAELARFSGTQSGPRSRRRSPRRPEADAARLHHDHPARQAAVTLDRRAKEVTDMFEEWFTAPACDGFVIGAACVPGSYEDFIAFVVPELQRRGLFQTDYKGATLRENLGLPRPVVARA